MVYIRVNSTTAIGMHVNSFLGALCDKSTFHGSGEDMDVRPRQVLLTASRPSTNKAHADALN